MKERPILFSSEMVRAILDGRKTQTRRVINPQPEYVWGYGIRNGEDHFSAHVRYPGSHQPDPWIKCPYGVPGDRLWVRETHGFVYPEEFDVPLRDCKIEYRADLAPGNIDYPGQWPADEARGNPDAPKWRPSIHMPRWASRILLEITAVRVERLQDIDPLDCVAEGASGYDTALSLDTHIKRFSDLWDKLNTKRGYPWSSNPWVWVIEFKKLPTVATNGNERGELT